MELLEISDHTLIHPHYARTSLCGLPMELLIRILWYTQCYGSLEYKSIMLLTEFITTVATCRHIRDVALATPELWTCLDHRWNTEWLRLCLVRSQKHALEIDWHEDKSKGKNTLPIMQDNLHRASLITWRLSPGSGQRFSSTHTVLSSTIPLLKELRLLSERYVFHLEPEKLGGWTMHLGTLRLMFVHLTSGLSFPVLRKLRLYSCRTNTAAVLIHLLRGLPTLEVFQMKCQYFDTEDKPCGIVYDLAKEGSGILPALRRLNMMIDSDGSWELFWNMHDPSHCFDMDTYCSTPEKVKRIADRLHTWCLRTGVNIPPVIVHFKGLGGFSRIRMGAPIDWNRPLAAASIHWDNRLCDEGEEQIPQISNTTHIVIDQGREAFFALHARHIAPPGLTSLEEVRLYRAYESRKDEFMESETYHNELAQLEAWFRSLAECGSPVKHLVLASCHARLEVFGNQIRDAGLVNEVQWITDI
jgi:hypothetical protein